MTKDSKPPPPDGTTRPLPPLRPAPHPPPRQVPAMQDMSKIERLPDPEAEVG